MGADLFHADRETDGQNDMLKPIIIIIIIIIKSINSDATFT